VLLDTDILSAILRQSPAANARARDYLREHGRFTLSVITRYEILRRLKAKNAARQQEAFERFCTANILLPLSEAVVVRASEIYAGLYRRGALIGDADILIAATALVEGYSLATNNERHFGRIKGLDTDNTDPVH
jgi:tRNA(fMet)-specific endonuclease VapC